MKILSNLFNRKRPKLISERIPSATYAQLPREISAKLKSAARRVRRIVFMRGLFATVAVFTVSILLVMAIDAMVVIFSPFVHWGLWLAVVAATAATAWRTMVQPLSIPLTPARIAALIEANHPELEERLSSVVELLGMGESLKASERLMEVLTRDAVTDVGKISVRRVFSARTVKPRFIAAAVAVAIVVALVAAFPKPMSRLIVRAVIPTAEVDNVYASALKVTPGDAVMLEGTPFTVQLAVESGFPSRAYVRTRPEGSRSETSERMTQTSADGKGGATYYSFSYPLLRESFNYRVHCGSALTRDFKVRVVPVPAYTNLEIKLEYPAYTKRAPGVSKEQKPSAIATVAGTKVEISALPNRSDLKAELLLPGGKTAEPAVESDGRFAFRFDLEDMKGQWGIQLSDPFGFSNAVEFASIEIVKDAAPEIRIMNPKDLSMELPTFGAIPFDYSIKDDFGFTSVRVEISDEKGGYVEAMALSPTETERCLWTGSSTIELTKYNLDSRNAVRFRLAAADNYPEELGGPHVSYSDVISVRLARNATSLAGKALAQQIKDATLTVGEVAKKLAQAKKSAEEASAGFASNSGDWRYKQAFPRLDESKTALLKSEQILSDLVKNLESTMLTAGGDILEKALEDYLVPARRFCEDVYLLESDKERADGSSDLAKKIQETIDALTKAKTDFEKAAEAAKDLQKLNEIAAREKALAEMAEKGEIDPEQFAKMQKTLLEEFNKEFADKLTDPLQKEKDQVAEMQKKGEDLKNRQEELKKDAEALKNGDDAAKAEAEKDLREKTKSMPSETSPEDRLAELEENLAAEIDKLAKDAEKMSGDFAKKEGDNEENSAAKPADAASENAKKAAEDARDAVDALKDGNQDAAGEKMDGVKENLEKLGEKLDEAMSNLDRQSEAIQGDVSQYRDAQEDMQAAAEMAEDAARNAEGRSENWDGERDPNAEVPNNEWNGERDPNQKWDGQKDPNAPEPDNEWNGERDPNQKWDGQKDPNAPEPDNEWNGERDPNQKWDGKKDPNAPEPEGQWDGNKERDPNQKWDGKKDPNAPEPEGQWDGNKERDPNQKWDGKIDPNAKQQQGQQQNDGKKQQQQQQGQQQNQQQGQQLNQQNQQQQGQQQNQQQGPQQQMQNAAQQAQQAAEAMKQATQQAMQQMGLTQQQQQQMQQAMDQQQGRQQQEQEQQGPENPNASESKSSFHNGHGLTGGKQDPLAGFNPNELIDWFKSHSETSADAIEKAMRNVPAEYRGLVKDYFDQLSKEAQK